MPRIKMTAGALRTAKPGDVLLCPEIRGLELRVRARSASWQLYYRAPGGEQRRPKLGEYPALSLSAAREAARDLLARVAKGADPSRQRAILKASPTVADLCERYMREHAEPRKRPRSVEEDRRNIRLHVIPQLGAIRVKDVTQAEVEALLLSLAKASGPRCANAVQALLSKMLNLAESAAWALRPPHSNPVRGTTRQVQRARTRKATSEELHELHKQLNALQEAYPLHVAALYVIMYSGSRVTEVLDAAWSDYDGSCIVRREHKTMRTGHDRVIRLPVQAREAIDALPRTTPLIFGGIDRYATFRVWEMARERASTAVPGVVDLRQQDLRRTFASVAKSSGVTLDQVGELFGHRDVETTRGYAYLYKEAADSTAQSVADQIERRAKGVK